MSFTTVKQQIAVSSFNEDRFELWEVP